MHLDPPTEPWRLLFGDALPAFVRVATSDPRHADLSGLLGREREVVARAVAKRQREFAAGRVLARGLFLELGVPADFELLNRADRSPAWPRGVVGSITHCDTLVAVAVARAADAAGIGIDVEPAEALPEGVDRSVMSPAEHARLGDGPPWMGASSSPSRRRSTRRSFP